MGNIPSRGNGGAAVWGDITGTLSDQTDLETDLNLKAPLDSPAFTGAVTVAVPASTAGPVVTCAAATSTSSGSGANAQAGATVTGAAGQATTFADPASTGGTGGGLTLTAGAGGANSDSDATSGSLHRAGAGGGVTLRAGAGGAGGGTGHSRGGPGGTAALIAGNGGNSAHDNGGAGGGITYSPGRGGTSLVAGTGGAGGSVSLFGADGGDTSGGTNGTGGSVTIDAGAAGSGGTGGANGAVSIGASAAASVAIGRTGIITALAGTVTATTQSQADNSTKVSTTAYVDTGLALKANLASPALTGNPTAPTQSAADNSTKLATTAYADAGLAAVPSAPYLILGGAKYGPIGAVTAPPLVSALTWVNQGGATASNVGAGNAIKMAVPGTSGDSLRYLHTAAYPTTPYTFTIGMKLMCLNADFQGHGIAISDGTKFAGFGLGRNGSLGAVAYTFATSTSDGATIGGIPNTSLLVSNEWYISVADDGTTITVQQGPDPLSMMTIGSATRATLGLTPTQVGIYMDDRNTGFGAQALFFHWLLA